MFVWQALAIDNKAVKALYRRAQAYVLTQEFDLAIRDFKQVGEMDESMKAQVTRDIAK